MKTIKDVAMQAGVSKTSIYNMVKRYNIPTFKKDGITYIDENGISLILAHYSVAQQETIQDILDDEFVQSDFQPNNQVENSHLISLLEKQLDEKDKTIQGLIQSNQSLIQAVTNQQTLQAIATKQVVETPKKSLWQRVFGKN